MTIISNEHDHVYSLPGYMLAEGDRVVGLHKKGEIEWEQVSLVLTNVKVWTMYDGLRHVTFTTEEGTEMTFKGSELFMVQMSNPEEKRH